MRRDHRPQTQVHKNYLRKYIYVLILNPPCGPPTPLAHTRGMRSLQRRVEPQPGTGRPKLPSGQDQDLLQRAVLPLSQSRRTPGRGERERPGEDTHGEAGSKRPSTEAATPAATRPQTGSPRGHPSARRRLPECLPRHRLSPREDVHVIAPIQSRGDRGSERLDTLGEVSRALHLVSLTRSFGSAREEMR